MPALVVRRLLVRGTVFWIGLRLLLLMLGHTESHPILAGIILFAIALSDLYRRNEVIFLANLGVGRRYAVLAYVTPAVLLELVLGQLL